jgi:ABC-type lipoprotein release transport system permease subunit
MTSEVVVAILGFAGTLAGSLLGVVAAGKLTQYRLQQLEEKVNEHNNVVKRTFIVEEKVNELRRDVDELKGYHKPKQ